MSRADAQASGITESQFSAMDSNRDGRLDSQEMARSGFRFRSGG